MKINELCDKKIPDLIAADRLKVKKLQEDRRTAKEIFDDFQPLLTILGHLRLYKLRHVATDVIDVTQLRREKEVRSGHFSTVYKAHLQLTGDRGSRVVSLKVLKRRIDGDEMYTLLTEMKGDVAKLCDLGLARRKVDSTGTFVGTMSHMSPEMLSNKWNTYKTDIYSLGIFLWELWYGRYVYSEDEYHTIHWTVLIDAIKAGTRPRCDKKYAMVDSLREIVEKCWDQDPTIRPEARDVALIIKVL
ncbi:STY17-like protein [Mya arenaria]|uniref:STY17-like protein n=1 Tax=Mya arenaria TaxID=6604 RepID=A0ABY7FUW8_MYAAR|nr:STY17-like protein [Mya arenaria]